MDNIHLIQLNSYERPTITEEKNQQWVGIGDNNDYYQCLIDAFMDSTTNNAVINGIVNQIYGKGLDATDSNRKPEQYAQMKGLLKPKDLRRVCQDLKLLGEGSFQVTYKGNQIASITHFPRETLRAEKCGEDGVIKNYLYSADWSKVTKNTVLKKFPVFGSGAKNEIYIVRKYYTGYFYYSPADWQTSYCTLEREIADYLINDAQSSFSGTKILNFNSGVPTEEKMQSIKNQVLSKLTGSYGEKVIIAFNDNAESKATIEDVSLTDAPAHYEYLSSECQRKIMLTHRVTSPLLLGLRDGNGGLGSNADEIKNASLLFNNVVIKPYQDLITDALDEMFAVNNISLNLYFKTIEPLEFMDVDDTLDAETIEEETGVKQEGQEGQVIVDDEMISKDIEKVDASYNGAQISSAIDIIAKVQEGILSEAQAIVFLIQFLQLPENVAKGFFSSSVDQLFHQMKENKAPSKQCFHNIDDKILNSIADELIALGEDEDLENYEVVDEREVDYDNEESLDKMLNLASTGVARPKAKSEQDGTSKQESQKGVIFKVRYTYAPKKVSANSREFCKKMIAADKVYRKEDIIMMDKKPVNAGFGERGASTYSIWLYKGGARCHHKWFRKTYMLKDGVQKETTSTKARSKGFVAPVNDQKVPVAPNDMPLKGYSPNNPNLPKDVR